MSCVEIEIEIEETHFTILERMASDEEITIEELISRIIHEQIEDLDCEEDVQL